MRLCEHCGAKFTADTGRATCSDRCARKLRNKQVQASMNKVPVFYIHAEIREANMERAETLYAEYAKQGEHYMHKSARDAEYVLNGAAHG